jgi:hypothetical protein
MEINQKKLDFYANKLYRGLLKKYKSGESVSDPRISPTSAQAKLVIKKKCAICPREYTTDESDNFEIHHIDGDRSHTVTSNLVLICRRCHTKVNTKAKAKLDDYKRERPKEKTLLSKTKPRKKIHCTICGDKGVIKCKRCGGEGYIPLGFGLERCPAHCNHGYVPCPSTTHAK